MGSHRAASGPRGPDARPQKPSAKLFLSLLAAGLRTDFSRAKKGVWETQRQY